jgi:hypothetical protein
MCSKLYGCSLKMTAVIRPENIASDEHILELLSILLKKELDNAVRVNIPHNIQNNRRTNGSALRPIQGFRPERLSIQNVEAYGIPPRNQIPINRRRNRSALRPMQELNNQHVGRNRMKQREYYQKQREKTIQNNINELTKLKERLHTAIREINTELRKSVYTDKEKNRFNEKRKSMLNYLREI